MALAFIKDPFLCQPLDGSVQDVLQFLRCQLLDCICQYVLVHRFLLVTVTTLAKAAVQLPGGIPDQLEQGSIPKQRFANTIHPCQP
jgi:hypothetical protein